MHKIKSETKSIKELFKSEYTLDYYQREYVWQRIHVRQLIDDLTVQFLANYDETHNRDQGKNYSYYFLGSIIIRKEGTQRFIIDGQQRLTTLTLLLIKLQHLLEDKSQIAPLIFSEHFGKKSFKLNIPERKEIMEKLCLVGSFDDKDQPILIKNINARYRDIESIFQSLPEQALPYFVDWLLERVCFVEITANSENDAYTIFETMNDRGLSLTAADMLRGYLLSNITDSDLRETASSVWRKRSQSLQGIGKDEGRKRSQSLQGRKDEDGNAIKAWLRSQYSSGVSDFDAIGKEFHRWVRNQAEDLGLKSSEAFANFIRQDFDFYGDQYCRLRQAAKSLTPGLECVYYNALNNFTLQYMFLLSLLSVSDTEEEISDKIRIGALFLDILIHRRIWNNLAISQSTMADELPRSIPTFRGKCSNELRNILYEELMEPTLIFAKNERLTFARNPWFSLHGGNRRRISLILARMTDYVEVQSQRPAHFSDYVRGGKNSYEIEHIWAKDGVSHLSEFSPHEFDEYRDRIGGLLLLPRRINASYGDLRYEEKRHYYLRENLLAASLHEQTYERNPGFKKFIEDSGLPFKPHPGFNKNDLDERQQLYQQIAERIWNPERLKLPYGEEPSEAHPYDSLHQDPEVGTIERIKNLIPEDRRKYYETHYRQRIDQFYLRVAELKNFVEEKGWKLELRFRKSYCAFYLKNRLVFGVILNPPRFAAWMTKQEAVMCNRYCKFERYSPQHRRAVYPIGTTIDTIRPILEFSYSKHQID